MLETPADIAGDSYGAVLEILLTTQSSFSLVAREQFDFLPSAHALLADLESASLRSERTHAWPGTSLLGSFATVYHFRTDPSLAPVLARPGSLYSWIAPQYPEDLAFYGVSGECTFGSISHEREVWVSDVALADALDKHLSPRVRGNA